MKSKLIVALDADSFQEAATQVPATRDVVDDQRRTMTPAEAIIARANYVVV
jgi:orotidine-5'-phosphate decarboxylase